MILLAFVLVEESVAGHQRGPAMCDYSLHAVATRPAKVGDRLVTTGFWNTTTRGFTAVGKMNEAVCLRPGTELAFDADVQHEVTAFQFIFSKRANEPICHRVARFRQVAMDNPCAHHDALEFPDGRLVLLTHLYAGQQATVLRLPAGVYGTAQTGIETEQPLPTA